MSQKQDPASGAVSVTPSDSTQLSKVSRALYVGSAGNVAVTMEDGTSVTFSNVTAGAVLPLAVRQVLSTGTTASNIISIF